VQRRQRVLVPMSRLAQEERPSCARRSKAKNGGGEQPMPARQQCSRCSEVRLAARRAGAPEQAEAQLSVAAGIPSAARKSLRAAAVSQPPLHLSFGVGEG
jgi:hypothetical protein